MSATTRLALLLAYDGGGLHGWQVQPRAPTVQGQLEQGLAELLGQPLRVTGAGRTDAGVHARGQVAHVDLPVGFPRARLRPALNARLPPSLRVLAARPVSPDFHALHSAVRKTYAYSLHLSHEPGGQQAVQRSVPPHRRRSFHAVRADLDREAMAAAALALTGEHDFTALSKAMPAGRGTVKRVQRVRLASLPRGLAIVVSGEGFLYGMVRLMAGLLVEVGAGRRRPDDVAELLDSLDRNRAPAALPAHGLCLLRVDYPGALLGSPPGRGRAALHPDILGPAAGST